MSKRHRHYPVGATRFGESGGSKGMDFTVYSDTNAHYLGFDASTDVLTFIGTTFTLTAALNLTGALVITGALSCSGDFAVNTDDFVVDVDGDITMKPTGGDVDITGTLSASGDFDINTTKFTVAGATGATLIKNTLGVGTNATEFTVAVDGAVAVATTKFTVSAAADLSSYNQEADATGTTWTVKKSRAAGAAAVANDVVLDIIAQGMNSTPALKSVAEIQAIITDVTAATEDGKISFLTMVAGAALAEKFSITSTVDSAVDFRVNTDDFVVDVDGDISMAPTGGDVDITGTLTVTGNFDINADVFVITAATGDITQKNDEADATGVTTAVSKSRAADAVAVAADVIYQLDGIARTNAGAPAWTTVTSIRASVPNVGAGTETGKIAFFTMFAGAAVTERLGVAADVTITLPEAAGANSFILTDSVPVTKLSVNSLGNLTSKNNQAAATGVTWSVSKSRAADAACTADDVILQTDGIGRNATPAWKTVTSARHIITNIGAGTEAGAILFLTMTAGAAVSEKFRIGDVLNNSVQNFAVNTDYLVVTAATGDVAQKNIEVDASGVTHTVTKARAAASCNPADVIWQLTCTGMNATPAQHEAVNLKAIMTAVGAGAEAGAFAVETVIGGAAIAEAFRVGATVNSVLNLTVATDYFVVTAATGDLASKNIEVDATGVTHTVTKARAAAVCVANDVIWQLTCTAMNSAPVQHEMVNLKTLVTDPAAGTEDGAFTVETVIAGAAIAEQFRVGATVNVVPNFTVATDYFVVTSTTGDLASKNIEVDATGVTHTITKARGAAVCVANDVIYQMDFRGMNSTPALITVASIAAKITDVTAGTEDGSLTFSTMVAGAAATERFRLDLDVNVTLSDAAGASGLKVYDSGSNLKWQTSSLGDITTYNNQVDATGTTWTTQKSRGAAACSDNDVALSIVAVGMNDTPALHDLASIDFSMADASNGTEDGRLSFKTAVNGSALGERLGIADTVNSVVDFTVNTTGFVVDIDGNIAMVPFTGIVDVTGQVRTTGDMRIGRMQWEDDFIEANNLLAATVLTKLFWTGGGAAGTQTLTLAPNGTIVLSTGAIGAQTSILTFTHLIFDTDAAPSMEFRIKSDLLTNRRVAAGFWASANDYLYFSFDTAVDAANIYLTSVNNGAAEVRTDTLVDLVNNTYFIGRIEIAADETFKFFINNVEVAAAHAGNTIRQLATFVPYFYIDNKAVAQDNLLTIDYVKVGQNRI